MLRDLKKSGFASIVEVIVTSVIFVLAAAGILTTVAMFKPHEQEASQKIEAAYIGKGIIDDLRKAVDATDWNDAGSDLAVGTYSTTVGIYTIDYEVTEPNPSVRHLAMNITWPDPY